MKIRHSNIKAAKDAVSNNQWVVVNIEYKLNNLVRLVPVKLDTTMDKEFTGWAWGERLHTYDTSQIVYEAKDEADALNFIHSNAKTRVKDIFSAEDLGNEVELDHPDQEFDSADTSINSNKLPAVYRMITIPEGTTGVDFGGGRFDNAVEHIKDLGATLCVYDPYNRSAEHNREVIKALRANGGADWAINSNVLNVIKEGAARKAVLENIAKITKSGAPIYITVYEGRGDGKDGPTKAGYQLNRKTADYLEEIQEVFPDAVRKGKLIIAHNNASVNSASNIESLSKLSPSNLEDSIRNTIMNIKNSVVSDYAQSGEFYTQGNQTFFSIPVPQYADMTDYNRYTKEIQAALPNVTVIDNSYENEILLDITRMIKYSHKYVNTTKCICSSQLLNTNNLINELININRLKDEIEAKVHEVMIEPPFGFLPDEVDEYSVVEVTEEDGRIKAEVRAELDYDGLFELCEALNPIVEKYDADAYFEPVEPGIADAYVENNNTSTAVNSSSFINQYGEHHDYVSRGGRKFSVYYNEIDNSPEADAHKMWEDFKAQVSMISPYDDADYVWANIKNGNIFIMKGNKAIDNSYYMDADDMDVENGEWCDAIIEQAIDNISEINDNIEPRIIHDSTEVTKSTVEASSYYDPSDVDDFFNSFLPEDDEVTADGTFDYEGEEYVWVGSRSDTIHLDFDNWCVWEAIKVEDATKQYENGTDADSWYFVVDTDTGFIDWGPCDTLKEARDFLNSKVDDWNEEVNSASNPATNNKPVNASWYDVPERDLNPPEYPEPDETVEDIGEVDFDLDCNIIMDSDGYWEYENNDYSFVKSDPKEEYWYSNEYNIPFEYDPVTIVEDLDELLIPLLPAEAGKYHIEGYVDMIYQLEDIDIYRKWYGEDDYDEDFDTDHMVKHFDANESRIKNFKWTKID